MNQEAIFFVGKRKNHYICGVLLLLMIYLGKGRKIGVNCFVNLLNRGLGVNLGLDFLFVGKEKIAMFASLWKLLKFL